MDDKIKNHVIIALKDAILTAMLVFLLTIILVGFETETASDQKLTFITHFASVFWSVIIIASGRFLIVLSNYKNPLPAIYIGGLGFFYFFILGLINVSKGHGLVPQPFAAQIVNAIFGLGSLLVLIMGLKSRYGRRRISKVGIFTAPLAIVKGFVKKIRLFDAFSIALIILAFILPITSWGDRKLVDSMILILTYIMLGWGLNIVIGLAGLLDLGYVAFYAVGAYTCAKLSTMFGFGFWEILPIAGMLAAIMGIVLGFPVLRLHGDYLAIVTLGFGEIIHVILINWVNFTGGPNGLGNIGKITFFGYPFTNNPPVGVTSFHQLFGIEYSSIQRSVCLYYIILFLAIITNIVTMRLRRLPIGRAWEALREDEIACRSLGISPTTTKLTAFAIGAMFAGFAGCFFATRQGFISPESFTFMESAIIVAIVVLGGMGSQIGVALAAIVLVGLPEFMRELELYRMLVFGSSMVLIMLWRPQGLLSHRDPVIMLPRHRRPSVISRIKGHLKK